MKELPQETRLLSSLLPLLSCADGCLFATVRHCLQQELISYVVQQRHDLLPLQFYTSTVGDSEFSVS